MDIKKLKTIYEVVRKSKAQEISLETKSSKLRMVLTASEKRHSEDFKKDSRDKTSSVPEALPEATTSDKFDILSPQIGFFSRYNPRTKQQYVKLRDQIQKGVVVASIRSMHLNYEVVAEQTGKIVEFLVEEGQPVEYHQPIIRLVPLAGK